MGKTPPFTMFKPMRIAGRTTRERERLLGMSDAERAWRKQWINDQILTENDPHWVDAMYKATHNPICRFYRWPLDKLFSYLIPYVGRYQAYELRMATGKLFMFIGLVYWIAYHNYYSPSDWTRFKGWRVETSKHAYLIGDKEFPYRPEKTEPHHYADRDFNKCTIKFYDD